MHKSTGITQMDPLLAILMAILIFASGCSILSPVRRVSGYRYYFLEPALLDENFRKNKDKVTDEDVVKFTTEVKTMVRERFNNARLARTGGGFIQVATSAAAALLTGTSGSSAVGASTILSGISAMIPEASNLIEAKDRAEVYSDSLKSIETAEALYLKAMAGSAKGKISTGELTREGANLYQTVVASIHVVEARLTGLLPTVQELRQARTEFEKIEVIPTTVSLKPKDGTKVIVSEGGPATAIASSNDQIASVKPVDNNTAAQITANRPGTATITFANSRGGLATVDVTVTP